VVGWNISSNILNVLLDTPLSGDCSSPVDFGLFPTGKLILSLSTGVPGAEGQLFETKILIDSSKLPFVY